MNDDEAVEINDFLEALHTALASQEGNLNLYDEIDTEAREMWDGFVEQYKEFVIMYRKDYDRDPSSSEVGNIFFAAFFEALATAEDDSVRFQVLYNISVAFSYGISRYIEGGQSSEAEWFQKIWNGE